MKYPLVFLFTGSLHHMAGFLCHSTGYYLGTKKVSAARATVIYASKYVWAELVGWLAAERMPIASILGGFSFYREYWSASADVTYPKYN